MAMTRVMVFDRLDNYVCDLNPFAVVELRNIGEVNAEHSLTIALRGQTLEKTNGFDRLKADIQSLYGKLLHSSRK